MAWNNIIGMEQIVVSIRMIRSQVQLCWAVNLWFIALCTYGSIDDK